ncbi:hypothetical protein OHA98_21270 [Streptomyces sp. NBC_00654]|uniref:hypothetical protein n=1 Tax=Streptomyces sp. NBC_00654 TaxID=2975799 RepID=UPI00224FB41A|nr:hypothetical protein [Streptomyces sp. NBC_00654]MCX4967250.1 hypothetical protein [Streptomyces sp. NBC_00654]
MRRLRPGNERAAAWSQSRLAPTVGFRAGARIVSVDLDAESPHNLVNASTGGGKSVSLRCIACQMLHHGSLVSVLDIKRISTRGRTACPASTYYRDIADMHDALVQLGMGGRRRTRVADELGIGAAPDAIGPRLLILLEESNATMKQLARYWDRTRALVINPEPVSLQMLPKVPDERCC